MIFERSYEPFARPKFLQLKPLKWVKADDFLEVAKIQVFQWLDINKLLDRHESIWSDINVVIRSTMAKYPSQTGAILDRLRMFNFEPMFERFVA